MKHNFFIMTAFNSNCYFIRKVGGVNVICPDVKDTFIL